jgi:hypothetical protein
VLGAPHPESRLRRRRTRPVDPPAEPETVPVTRVTVARAEPLEAERAAEAWLESTAGDPKRRVAEAKGAVGLINRALEALREATEDPLVHDVGASQALAIRIGYGTGDQLADGRWTEAEQLPPPPASRRDKLDPQEQVARALSGRAED